ncbi:Putative thioredoxin [gamma proteobacterium HdN1]|nr:Putative thioredoxin [gamma proteobacterium HdN1]
MPALHVVCPNCHARNRVPADRLKDKPRCGVCKQTVFTGHPAELDDTSFAAHAEGSDIPVVVDFWAGWCGPCRAFAPTFSAAAAQLEPKLRFAKVNVDEAQQTAARFNIRSIPTLAIFRDGKEIGRQAGALSPQQLMAWLAQFY